MALSDFSRPASLSAFLAEYGPDVILQTTGQRIMHRLRPQVYGHLQRLELRYYDRHPVGRLMTRVTTDVDALNDLFASGVVTVFGDVLVLTGIMVAMLLMNWRLALGGVLGAAVDRCGRRTGSARTSASRTGRFAAWWHG